MAAEPFASVDGGFAFVADGGLWWSDGTLSGTNALGAVAGPRQLTAVRDQVFFTVGSDLWRTDGTDAGTVLLEMLEGISRAYSPQSLTPVGSRLVFSADLYDRTNFSTRWSELWSSDGTTAGTRRVLTREDGLERTFPTHHGSSFRAGPISWAAVNPICGRQTELPPGRSRCTCSPPSTRR
jgi:ELWxxDGT repeat protein